MLRWFVILQFQKRFNHRLYEFVVFLRKKELFRRSTCGVTCTPSSHVLFICIELSLKATTTIYSMHTHNATAASQKWLEICSIIEHWTLDILIRLHANKSVKQMSFFPYKWDLTQNPKIKWWKMHRMLFLDRAKAKVEDNLPGIIIKASVCHVFEMFRCRFVCSELLFTISTVFRFLLALFTRFPPQSLSHSRVQKYTLWAEFQKWKKRQKRTIKLKSAQLLFKLHQQLRQ